MTPLRKFVEALDVEELLTLHQEYLHFEEVGSIGDSALRDHISDFCELNANDVVFGMMAPAFMAEVWRALTKPVSTKSV